MEARNGKTAQLARLDDLLGLLDEGIVATMLAHEHGHTGSLGLGGKCLGVGKIIGDGLFHQGNDAAIDGLTGNAQMQAVRSSDNHALGLDLVHHGRRIGVERHAGSLGRGTCALKGVRDGHELGLGLLGNKTNVVATHGASTNDGDAHGSLLVRHGSSFRKAKRVCHVDGKKARLGCTMQQRRRTGRAKGKG